MAIAFALYDYVIEYNDGMTNKNKHTHTRTHSTTANEQTRVLHARKVKYVVLGSP